MTGQDAEWEAFKAQVRMKWPELTDADVDDLQGRFDSLPEVIQKRYAVEPDEARRQVDDWVQSVGDQLVVPPALQQKERGA